MLKKSLLSMSFLLSEGKVGDTMVTQEKQGISLARKLLVL
jgi:hypothetical protein